MILYNYKTNDTNLNTDIYVKFTECIKSGKRFIYILLLIKNFFHVNLLLVDTKTKTFERFEPEGYTNKEPVASVNNKIDDFSKKILEYLELKKYKYISPKDLYNGPGIQQKVGLDYNDTCLPICMMYLHMRIINPDVKPQKIIKYFLKKPKEELENKILKYIKYMERKLST